MAARWLRLLALATLAFAADAKAATVAWDGGGGNLLWSRAENWSTDTLPSSADDVVIAVPAGVSITSVSNVTIRSLQCDGGLAVVSGTFRVTQGNSTVSGGLSLGTTVTLSVTGSGTALTATGPTDAGACNFDVSGGARLHLPQLGAYARGAPCTTVFWKINGAGTRLELPGLTNLIGGACVALDIQAQAGGTIDLTGLISLGEGATSFLASGSNSVVDLSSLQGSTAIARILSFEARGGGSVQMPHYPGGPATRVIIDSAGGIDVANLRELDGFSVTGRTLTFPALTNLTAGSISVRGGSAVVLPGLREHQHGTHCDADTWEVTGPGSTLELPALTRLVGASCGFLTLSATGGGQLRLNQLTTVPDGTLNFLADGQESRIELASLGEASTAIRTLGVTARNGGTFVLPQFAGGPSVRLTLEPGGVLPIGQFRRLNGLTVQGLTAVFSALTNLTGGPVLATGGASVTLPQLSHHINGNACTVNSWAARGIGSMLSLPALTNLTGSTCGALALEASDQGRLQLPRLASIREGQVNVLADGTNSVIDLSALEESSATQRTVNLDARNSGAILTPALTGGPTVNVTLQSGGEISVDQLRLVRGLTVSGTTLALPGITNLFSGNLVVRNGGVLRLPNLIRHQQAPDCSVSTWEVNGAGSELDLSDLTHLTGNACGDLRIQALAGGRMNLASLELIQEGSVTFVADGAGSRMDLTALERSDATSRPVAMEARNGGVNSMPHMTGGATVSVTVQSNGVISVAALQRLNRIVANAAVLEFPALTNFDNGTLAASNSAHVSAPGILEFLQNPACAPANWLVRDAGTVAAFPGLRQLTAATCVGLDIQALAGGQLQLGALTDIRGGPLRLVSADPGSVVDLHALTCFVNASLESRMTATNGGVILWPGEPLVLSGVALNLAGASPADPRTVMNASNLVLRARPWLSYLMEVREDSPPAAAWHFLRRVPLTNTFQIVEPAPADAQAYRVTEFVADSCTLELTSVSGQGIGLVLYGPPGQSCQVQRVDELLEPVAWINLETIAMTNSFRILASDPGTQPQRSWRTVPRP